jgi:hypothetical protein
LEDSSAPLEGQQAHSLGGPQGHLITWILSLRTARSIRLGGFDRRGRHSQRLDRQQRYRYSKFSYSHIKSSSPAVHLGAVLHSPSRAGSYQCRLKAKRGAGMAGPRGNGLIPCFLWLSIDCATESWPGTLRRRASRGLASHNRIIEDQIGKIQEFTFPLESRQHLGHAFRWAESRLRPGTVSQDLEQTPRIGYWTCVS